MKFKEFNRDTPGLREYVAHQNNKNSNGDMLYVRFHVKENKLMDDVGILVSDEREEVFPSMLEEYRKVVKDFDKGTFGRLYVCFYEYSDFYTVIDRNYLKITDAVV